MTRISFELWVRGQHIETCELDRERVEIGADPGCDLVVAYDGVASQHALVKLERGDLVVAPVGGERVVHNGRAVVPMQRPTLWAGDVIELGTAKLLVDLEPPPTPAAVPSRLPRRDRRASVPPIHAALLVAPEVVLPSRRQACADAIFAYLISERDARVAPWVLAELLDRGEAPPDDLAQALCRGVAEHRMLAWLLPRIADHAGWGTLAASTYGYVPEDLRDGLERTLLGHASWRVRLAAARSLRDVAPRERALRAVRRSFVASDFSPGIPTVDFRPNRRIAVERGPELPVLRAQSAEDPEPPRVPLALDAAAREVVLGARDAELAAAREAIRQAEPPST